MGFLDKAKNVAEQAQDKLDEAQKQLRAAQGGKPAEGPAVEQHDEHGRPAPQAPPDTATPPQGDPLAGVTPAARTAGPVPDPQAPPASEAPAPHGDRPPAPPHDDGPPADRKHPSYAPPNLTSGDPLHG